MLNLIDRIYTEIDDLVMHSVNKGVRVWNWATGRTKADLANILVGTAWLNLNLCIVYRGIQDFIKKPQEGFYIALGEVSLLAFTSFYGYFLVKNNNRIDRLETRANLSGLHNIESLQRKEKAKIAAPVTLLCAPISGVSTFQNDQNNQSYLLAPTFFLMGLEEYVMRADSDLPYDKGIISRVRKSISKVRATA